MSDIERTHPEVLPYTYDSFLDNVDISKLPLYQPEAVPKHLEQLILDIHKNIALTGGAFLIFDNISDAHAILQEASNALRNSKAVTHYAGVFEQEKEDGEKEVVLIFIHPSLVEKENKD